MSEERRRPVFGEDDLETWSRSYQNPGKREYDRKSKQRQRLRSKFAPEPLFFDDTPGPGRLRSGLIEPRSPKKRRQDEEQGE